MTRFNGGNLKVRKSIEIVFRTRHNIFIFIAKDD
ncbi:hypothetical protein BJV40_001156 [Clostridium beijerinckii]|nr:hypothetical protein [Clostridium beijerinckii]